MEIVLLLIVLILLIVVNRTVNTKYWNLERRQKDVLDKLYNLEQKIDALELQKKAETYEESAPVEEDTPKEESEIINQEFTEPDPVVEEVVEEEPVTRF